MEVYLLAIRGIPCGWLDQEWTWFVLVFHFRCIGKFYAYAWPSILIYSMQLLVAQSKSSSQSVSHPIEIF